MIMETEVPGHALIHTSDAGIKTSSPQCDLRTFCTHKVAFRAMLNISVVFQNIANDWIYPFHRRDVGNTTTVRWHHKAVLGHGPIAGFPRLLSCGTKELLRAVRQCF